MECDPVEGDPGVGPGKTPGSVYQQQPAAGAVAKLGTTVRVVFYRGNAAVANYVGARQVDACAGLQAAGFTCQAVEGRTAAGTGQQPGIVYQQSPAAGTTLQLGQTVTVTFLSGTNDLPDYRGLAPDAACADAAARGFGCNPVQQLFPSTNRVEAQDQPAGRYPLGSVVTVRYSPWGLAQFSIYQKNDADVWVLRVTGDIPAGYGRQAFVVGTAYLANTQIPAPRFINGFFCTAGNKRCNGLDVNHFYTAATSYGDPLWNGPNPIATFMNCGLGLGHPIYRTWNAGSPRFYKITGDQAAALRADGYEQLGCVW
jgi:hypothetical protein